MLTVCKGRVCNKQCSFCHSIPLSVSCVVGGELLFVLFLPLPTYKCIYLFINSGSSEGAGQQVEHARLPAQRDVRVLFSPPSIVKVRGRLPYWLCLQLNILTPSQRLQLEGLVVAQVL